MKHWYSLCFILCLAFFPNTSAAQVDEEDFTLFSRWIDWSSPASMLAWHLNEENLRLLAERESIVAQTVSKDDWLKRRDEIRATLKRIVGPFPERSGLNTKISRIIQRDGYRVEKLVYESLPEFHVTAALFIPDGIRDPRPGILNVIGHSAQAFRRDTYQNVILNLVAKGFVVLAIDPLGQGERLQYFDPETGESSVGSSTREHSYVGNQCLLSGYSVSRYFIWDGMRGIDYLQSRPEVDASRIGVTGLSGGGTQTALIAAMDERVSVAVPTCYITGYRRLLQSIGPQDGEQNLFHALANGIDHAELLVARIPKPTLVVATTRDFFSIQGVHTVLPRKTTRQPTPFFRSTSDFQVIPQNEISLLWPRMICW
jgi:dienelactone hydrolase